MKPEIKQRIEQIRRGEVPDGYKKAKGGIVPNEWKEERIGNYICEYVEKTTIPNQFPVLTSARTGLMFQTDYYSNRQVTTENNVGYNVIPYGYITFRSRSDDGYFHFNENRIIERGIISYFYPVFSFINKVCQSFMLQLLNHTIYKRMYPFVEGTAQQVLSLKKLGNLLYALPSKEEQEQIVKILSTQDKVIELYEKKIEQLQLLKKVCLQKMFPKQGRNVPEVRFPGFTEPWEQRKLGELFDFLQNNTLSRAELNNESGVAKNIHYGDILIKFGECIDISIAIMPFISSQSIAEKFKNSFLKNGDIIMADTAEDETVGKCSEVFSIQNIPIISGLHTIPMRPRKEFALGYLGYFMNSALYHDQLIPLMHGVKVTSISKGQIQNTNILYPKNINEQACLGLFFLHLDHLITLHQRKYDEEKRKKKALMQLLLTGIVRV